MTRLSLVHKSSIMAVVNLFSVAFLEPSVLGASRNHHGGDQALVYMRVGRSRSWGPHGGGSNTRAWAGDDDRFLVLDRLSTYAVAVEGIGSWAESEVGLGLFPFIFFSYFLFFLFQIGSQFKIEFGFSFQLKHTIKIQHGCNLIILLIYLRNLFKYAMHTHYSSWSK